MHLSQVSRLLQEETHRREGALRLSQVPREERQVLRPRGVTPPPRHRTPSLRSHLMIPPAASTGVSHPRVKGAQSFIYIYIKYEFIYMYSLAYACYIGQTYYHVSLCYSKLTRYFLLRRNLQYAFTRRRAYSVYLFI